jgi:structural maintenance of chromosome 2
LTGGSRPKSASVLDKVKHLNEMRKELTKHEKELASIMSKLAELKATSEGYKDIKQKYTLKSHELELFNQRIAENPEHQVRERRKKKIDLTSLPFYPRPNSCPKK